MKRINKSGFTLAELLITLVIIAVVAALALPALNALKPDKENIMYQKAYNLLGRCVYELINDEELYPDGDAEAGEGSGFANTTEKKYMGAPYSGDSKFCGLVAAKMNLDTQPNCNGNISVDNFGNFITTDGIIWSIPQASFAGDYGSGYVTVTVDVNGFDVDKNNDQRRHRPPNCFKSNCPSKITPDRYEIKVYSDGRMVADTPMSKDFK